MLFKGVITPRETYFLHKSSEICNYWLESHKTICSLSSWLNPDPDFQIKSQIIRETVTFIEEQKAIRSIIDLFSAVGMKNLLTLVFQLVKMLSSSSHSKY